MFIYQIFTDQGLLVFFELLLLLFFFFFLTLTTGYVFIYKDKKTAVMEL